jgi:hypothetical protein
MIISDELHHLPTQRDLDGTIKRATSTFIAMIASISHVLHLNISFLNASSGAAVRERCGTLSFSLPRQYHHVYDRYDVGIAVDG